MAKRLPLYGMRNGQKGQVIGHTVVDDEVYPLVSQWRWNRTAEGYAHRTYAIIPGRGGKRRGIYLHRLIAKAPDHLQVDHINRDRLDNRRSNLRLSDNRLNKQNTSSRAGASSRYRGVTWAKERMKWEAKVQLNGKTHHLGRYVDELEAAVVAAEWRKKHMPHTQETLV